MKTSKKLKARKRAITLNDIADKAGVSVNTVSRAIRNMPDVKETTRQTIIHVAKECGYALPLQVDQRRENPSIGMLIQDIVNPFYAKVIQGVERVLWQERSSFQLGCSYRQESKERDLLAFFKQQQVDGLLILTVVNPEYVMTFLEQTKIPTVFLSQRFEQYNVDYVINDNYEGASLAIDHLLKLGHTRIAYIMAFNTRLSAHERFRGYKTTLENAGLPVDNRLLRFGDNTVESGYYLTKDLLQSGEHFTALFTYNDQVALGALKAIREARLRVPTDISLVGYDDTLFAEFFDVPLTTVYQPIDEISSKATELLFAKIQAGPAHTPQQIVLKPRLIVRSSTSICPQ